MIQVEGAGAGIVVDGDATLLRHAIGNLLLNAVQALAVSQRERRIWLRLERGADVARVIVEDNGPGIAPEAAPRLFEPFFTTREVGEGMGLGLAISLGIAEEHAGGLRLESREGGGVRAELWLPLSGAREEA